MVLMRFAVLFILSSTLFFDLEAQAKTLRGVRFGRRAELSRVVFDVPAGTSYRLETGPDPHTLRVVFPTLTLAPALARPPATDPLLQDVRVRTEASTVIAEILLKHPGTVRHQAYVGAPPRVVVDIARRHDETVVPGTTETPRRHEAPAPKQTKNVPGQDAALGSGSPQPAPLAPASPTQATPPSPRSASTNATVPLTSLSATQLLERAEQHWQARQIEAAQRAYTTFLQRYPDHANNHLVAARVADILREQHHPRAALEAYTAVLQGYPGSEGALISQIRLAELGVAFPDLLPPGDEPRYMAYRQPIPTMERLIAEYPFSPFADVARLKIGEILLHRRDLLLALESFEALLGRTLHEPLRQEVMQSLRQALTQLIAEQQQRGASLEVLRTFFAYKQYLRADDAVQSEVLLPVALSYVRLGLLDEAQSLLGRLLVTLPQPEQRASLAFEQALRLAKSGQLHSATPLLTPPERFLDPAMRAQALTLLTQEAWQRRHLDDTVRYGQQAVEALTEPAERHKIWLVLGDAYEARGEPERALQVLLQCAATVTQDTASAVGPQAETCLVRATVLQAQSGASSQALALYERLLQTFPQSTSKEATLFRLADLHRQQGDKAQMLAAFTRLRDNTSETFWHKVATEYLDQAQWHESLQERLAAFQNSLMR